jgi:hypothetical protein
MPMDSLQLHSYVSCWFSSFNAVEPEQQMEHTVVKHSLGMQHACVNSEVLMFRELLTEVSCK